MNAEGTQEAARRSKERAVIAKVVRRIFPLVFLGYFFSFLDRVNIGFASLQMNAELHLSPAVFAFGASIFFISYVLLEVPSNLIMEKVGARIWLGRILVTWGLISALTSCVVGEKSLYLVRFLLGMAEAGWVPGLFLYLCYWFPDSYRARSQLLFLLGAPFSIVVGGPLSGLILDSFNGFAGISGWRWLFIVEGLPTVLLGIAWLVTTSDRPEKAKWLTAEEKSILQNALANESLKEGAGGHASLRTLLNPTVLTLCVINFIWCIGFYGLIIWTPQIVKEITVQSNFHVGLLSAIPAAVGAITMFLWARHSDRKRERRWHAGSGLLVAGISLVLMASAPNPYVSILALTATSVGIYMYFGTFWSLVSEHLSKRSAAAGFALVVAVGNIGGFVGPYFIGLMRQFLGDFRYAVIGVGATLIVGAMCSILLKGSREAPGGRRPAADRNVAST